VTPELGIVGKRFLDGLTLAASRAAAAILAVNAPDLARREKPDNSPVTAADDAAQSAILEELARLLPGVPVLSEESAEGLATAAPDRRFVLVDPLDGTRELLAGEIEYAVNIALIEDGVPAIGVIFAPAMGQVWRGIVGHGAERLHLAPGDEPQNATDVSVIRTRPQPARGAVALVSRFHREAETDTYLDRLPEVQRRVVGASIKFCRLAEGAADVYPRMSPMWPWDVAAGHALVTAAGGVMKSADGRPLTYERPGERLPPFIAFGDPASARWR
jgi:3'(2'), 5'-bisphosphate nucleotidase